MPVYSLLLVCVLPLSLHTRPRVHWASGIPHALFRAEGFLQDSGASRGEIGKSCLELEQTPSFRGDAKHRTRNLEIPGLVLRTIPE